MQWRKASEGDLPPILSKPIVKYRMHDNSEIIGRSNYDRIKALAEATDYYRNVEWLDETPTTPTGMQKRYKLMENVEQKIGYTIGWADAIEYKSHTAPKAEEPHRSAEEQD